MSTCKLCGHFVEMKLPEAPAGAGNCFRYPPSVAPLVQPPRVQGAQAQIIPVVLRPVVAGSDHCGEFVGKH